MQGTFGTTEIVGIFFILIILIPFALLLTYWGINKLTEDDEKLIPDDPKDPTEVGVFSFFKDLLFSKDED